MGAWNESSGVPGWEIEGKRRKLPGDMQPVPCSLFSEFLDFNLKELRHIAELVVAGGNQFGDWHLDQLREIGL